MANNEIDDIYGTNPQVDFAREMAKVLLKRQGNKLSPGMAVLPGSWMYGIQDVVEALAGTQYRDIAGSQDKTLAKRAVYPNTKNPAKTLGRWINQPNTPIPPKPVPAKRDMSSGPLGRLGGPPLPPGAKPFDSLLAEGGTPQLPIDIAEGEKSMEKKEGVFNFRPEIENSISTAAERHGISPDMLRAFARIESGGDPSNRTGGYHGLYQLSPQEFKKYGGVGNIYGIDENTDAAARKLKAESEEFVQKYGREPSASELYMIHQQGVGGSAAHWENPDQLAWKSMLSTGEGRQKGERWSKQAIWGNVPGDMKHQFGGVDNITSKQFTDLWDTKVDRFGGGTSATAADPDVMAANSGRMNLGMGGVTEQPKTVPAGQQLAQGYKTTPTTNPKASPIIDNKGAYEGQVPPANPIESDPQLVARILGAGSTEERRQILEDHFKKMEGRSYETPGGGKLIVTPGKGDKQPLTTHIPGKDIDDFMGMGIKLRQMPDGSFKLLTPSGSEIPNTVEGLNKYKAELQRQREQVKSVGDAQVHPITEAITQGNAVPDALRTLTTIEGTVKSSNDISMGPTSSAFNQVKRGLANFFPGIAKGISEADTIEKLNTLLASESTKNFTNRGTNFDLQTFMRANPGLEQSKEGMLMIVDILKQEMQQKQDIGKIANKYRTKDPQSWLDRKQEYYDDNPIIIRRPLGNNKFENVTTKKITKPEDAEGLPKGTRFMIPGEDRLGTVR